MDLGYRMDFVREWQYLPQLHFLSRDKKKFFLQFVIKICWLFILKILLNDYI
jgi:hypothetical protein